MDLTYRIPCFVVALDELVLEVYTGTALTDCRVRFEVGYYRLTSLIKARWGLGEMRERFPDLWESLMAGVLP